LSIPKIFYTFAAYFTRKMNSGIHIARKRKKHHKLRHLAWVVGVLLFLVITYVVYYFLMQQTTNQGYEPVQPIHFSHKVHAGDNKIDCQFCHSGVRSSGIADIPPLSVCMTCHTEINEYFGDGSKKANRNKPLYDNEIKKLYKYVGFNGQTFQYTGQKKPIQWVRVNNLPDHVHFNHSQHVVLGKLDCQVCHGEVSKMETVRQAAPLTMGWCIECHRTMEVQNLNGKYYQNYKEEHARLAKKLGVKRLTVAQLGGTECSKCHY